MNNERPATILVVDDNPAGRYATSRILRGAGFEVLEAATGMEGYSLAPRSDLVVLDVNLPDISGFEVCRKIRSTVATARLPVVHLSATFVQDTDKVQGLEAGADGYLTHPVEPPVLVATINAFLRTRRAEDAMRASEAKFKAIFDQALSGILLVSKDLVYLEANPAMCQILGRTREEIVGRHNSSFVPAGHEHDTIAIAEKLEENGSWRGTFPLIRADGTNVQLEWNISRHSLPGVRMAIVNDVTERRANEVERDRLLAAERAAREEAERANRLKDEFLATLSHELRTPLNAIVGWSEILKNGDPTSAEIAEGIDAIKRNAQSQSQLIADLLDVSRITSGNLRLDLRPVNVVPSIKSAIETIMPAIHAKGIRLESTFASAGTQILGDVDRIQQIIWNIVNNAVKFTPNAGTIRVAVERDGDDVVIAVSDSGRGIAADFLPHIFERFRQEDATTRRNQGGLGLGLAIVKHLVEMHGGSIVAQSKGEGFGAAFIVRLPAQADSKVEETEPLPDGDAASSIDLAAESHSELPIDLSGFRILIVDDDADARWVLKRCLTRSGANVVDVGDVQSCLAKVKEFAPELLISDVGMPDEDGYDLIRAIRGRGYTPQDLPAIAMTAFARNTDRDNSISAGFQFHLAKPVDTRELFTVITSLQRKT